MDLSGFAIEGALRVDVVRYVLSGEQGRHSVVTECTLVVDYEEGPSEEITVPFGENPPALASLLAMVRVLNERLER